MVELVLLIIIVIKQFENAKTLNTIAKNQETLLKNIQKNRRIC